MSLRPCPVSPLIFCKAKGILYSVMHLCVYNISMSLQAMLCMWQYSIYVSELIFAGLYQDNRILCWNPNVQEAGGEVMVFIFVHLLLLGLCIYVYVLHK